MPSLDLIMKWEDGTATVKETLDLFSSMIQDGTAWTFQGMYGRQARALIEGGFITKEGVITEKGQALISEQEGEDE